MLRPLILASMINTTHAETLKGFGVFSQGMFNTPTPFYKIIIDLDYLEKCLRKTTNIVFEFINFSFILITIFNTNSSKGTMFC